MNCKIVCLLFIIMFCVIVRNVYNENMSNKNNNNNIYHIPKIIHQTWYKKDIPEPIKKHIDKMRSIHPSYKYNFYDDDDIDDYLKKNATRREIQAYNKLSIGAEKADFFRYIILYYDGGIYVDLDSAIIKNIDKLIKNKSAIITREENSGLFVQWCLMFSPKHPILKKTIELCVDNINSEKYNNNIHSKTGPMVYSNVIKNILNSKKIYNIDDKSINNKLKKYKNPYIKRTYFYKIDYDDYAIFTIPEKELMYKEKKHWKEEQVDR